MTYGFVYMLRNVHMPDLVKIGCTERSPHQRADELSKGTAMPGPFEVVCYIEVADHQAVERRMHGWLAEHRVSPNREFFSDACGRQFLVGLFIHQNGILAFTDVSVLDFCGEASDAIIDPWRKVAEPEPPEPALTVIEGGKETAA